MFRKIFIASILTLGLAIPFAFASSASAHPARSYYGIHRGPVFVPSVTIGFGPVVVSPAPVVVTPTYASYLVQYRPNPGMPWVTAGSYASLAQAQFAAQNLRARGYEAFVRGY